MQDGYDQALSGLLRKRAELAQAVETHRLAWERSVASLQAIDQAVLVFNPSLTADVLPEKMVAPPFTAGNAPLQRFLLDELRRTGAPIRTLDATTAVMKDRGLDVRDRVVMTLIRKRVGDAFSRLRLAGHVTGAKYGSGSELEWRLIVPFK